MQTKWNNILTVLFFLFAFSLQAQQDSAALDADGAFKMAREKAFAGNREEAREILLNILKGSPDYDDVRIFLARTYAWDKQRELSRTELHIVLVKAPAHEDAISALTDVEMWDEQFGEALRVVNNGLNYYPNSADFLFKKASVLNYLHRSDEALLILKKLLTVNPAHVQGIALKESIELSKMKYTAGIFYGLDVYSRTFKPANFSSVQVARVNSWGSAIFRANYSSRFNLSGLQVEADAYPRIANGVYAYVNYGFSKSDLFPAHRIGGEIYSKLPKSLEASMGIRYLYFTSGTKVLIYTGSLGWYFKNYWLSFRPYIIPDKVGTSFSSTVSLRRYFKDANNYLEVNGGMGFSPDERRIQNGMGLSSAGVYSLKSQLIGVLMQKTLPHHFILGVYSTLIHQELSFEPGSFVWITSNTITLKKQF